MPVVLVVIDAGLLYSATLFAVRLSARYLALRPLRLACCTIDLPIS